MLDYEVALNTAFPPNMFRVPVLKQSAVITFTVADPNLIVPVPVSVLEAFTFPTVIPPLKGVIPPPNFLG